MAYRMGRVVGVLVVAAAAAYAANVELTLSQPAPAKLAAAACLHESPAAASPTVICLMEGAAVTLVARMQEKEKVEGKEGYWYKATVAGGAEGWVFSTFLTMLPAGDCGGCDKPCGK